MDFKTLFALFFNYGDLAEKILSILLALALKVSLDLLQFSLLSPRTNLIVDILVQVVESLEEFFFIDQTFRLFL